MVHGHKNALYTLSQHCKRNRKSAASRSRYTLRQAAFNTTEVSSARILFVCLFVCLLITSVFQTNNIKLHTHMHNCLSDRCLIHKKAVLVRHAGAKGERKYCSYSFFTSALDDVSGQRHAPASLYPRGRTPGTHWIGGWVSLDTRS
jgi:hypothetical protein